jgi:SAM-dependent methyltransferase
VTGPERGEAEEAQRRFFEKLADRYDRRFLRSRWPRNQELKARVIAGSLGSALDDGPVVELGCGTAQVAAELLRAHPGTRYVGLDLSVSMLERARDRLAGYADRVELRAVHGTLPLEAGSVAGGYGVDVLHHIADPGRVLGELRAALQPGAPIVFLEANPRFPITALMGLFQREERGVLRITPSNLRNWLAGSGFEAVSVEYGRLYTPPGPRRAEPLLDRAARVAASVPLVRGLAIFYLARACAPAR